MVVFQVQVLSDDGTKTFSTISLHIYLFIILVSLAMCWILKDKLTLFIFDCIDYLISTILEGPLMRHSIAGLVEDILKRDSLSEVIATTVKSVLSTNEVRNEIASVVQDVLSDDRPLRSQIANIVRDVLHSGVVESKIAEVVSGCLSNDVVAQGIVTAMKGTSFNVLNGASQKALSYIPEWASMTLRRRQHHLSDDSRG